MIVQRGDVDADAVGDVAGAQALEALLGDQRTRRGRDLGAAPVCLFWLGRVLVHIHQSVD